MISLRTLKALDLRINWCWRKFFFVMSSGIRFQTFSSTDYNHVDITYAHYRSFNYQLRLNIVINYSSILESHPSTHCFSRWCSHCGYIFVDVVKIIVWLLKTLCIDDMFVRKVLTSCRLFTDSRSFGSNFKRQSFLVFCQQKQGSASWQQSQYAG